MKLKLFDGGLNTRSSSYLLHITEAQEHHNVDSSYGDIRPLPSPELNFPELTALSGYSKNKKEWFHNHGDLTDFGDSTFYLEGTKLAEVDRGVVSIGAPPLAPTLEAMPISTIKIHAMAANSSTTLAIGNKYDDNGDIDGTIVYRSVNFGQDWQRIDLPQYKATWTALTYDSKTQLFTAFCLAEDNEAHDGSVGKVYNISSADGVSWSKGWVLGMFGDIPLVAVLDAKAMPNRTGSNRVPLGGGDTHFILARMENGKVWLLIGAQQTAPSVPGAAVWLEDAPRYDLDGRTGYTNFAVYQALSGSTNVWQVEIISRNSTGHTYTVKQTTDGSSGSAGYGLYADVVYGGDPVSQADRFMRLMWYDGNTQKLEVRTLTGSWGDHPLSLPQKPGAFATYSVSSRLFSFGNELVVSAPSNNFVCSSAIGDGFYERPGYYQAGNVPSMYARAPGSPLRAALLPTDGLTGLYMITNTMTILPASFGSGSSQPTSWVYTYYSEDMDWETPPSPISDESTAQLQTLTVYGTDSSLVSAIRLYRIGGNLTDFTLVVELPNEDTTLTDYIEDIAGNHILSSDENVEAPELVSLTRYEDYLIGLTPKGTIAFSAPGLPYRWPLTNRVTVPNGPTCLVPYYIGLLAFSPTNIVLLTGSELTQQRTISDSVGCEEFEKIIVDGPLVIFPYKDDLWQLSNMQVENLSFAKIRNAGTGVKQGLKYLDACYWLKEDGGLLRLYMGSPMPYWHTLGNGKVYEAIKTDGQHLYGVTSDGGEEFFIGGPSQFTYKSGNIDESESTLLKSYEMLYITSEGTDNYLTVWIDGNIVLEDYLLKGGPSEVVQIPVHLRRGYRIQFKLTGSGIIREIICAPNRREKP